jgi:hypothetical protein
MFVDPDPVFPKGFSRYAGESIRHIAQLTLLLVLKIYKQCLRIQIRFFLRIFLSTQVKEFAHIAQLTLLLALKKYKHCLWIRIWIFLRVFLITHVKEFAK